MKPIGLDLLIGITPASHRCAVAGKEYAFAIGRPGNGLLVGELI